MKRFASRVRAGRRALSPAPRLGLALGLALGLGGACARKPAPAPQTPVATAPATPKKVEAPARPVAPRPEVSYYSADLRLAELGDLLASSDKLSTHWGQERSMSTRDLLATFLNNIGFAPNILERLNLQKPIYAHFDLPHDTRSTREHFDLAISLPSPNPKELIAGLPVSLQLKAEGEDQWKAKLADLQLALKGGPDFLSIARSEKNLARAAKDRSAPAQPDAPRLHVDLDELSDTQRRAVINSLPAGLGARLAPALSELARLSIDLDMGSERPFLGRIWAQAPWSKLNLPLAAPSTPPSSIAERLPGGAAFASQLMLGDTKPVVDQLRDLAKAQVPVPFTEPSVELLNALQGLSEQVKTQVIAAYYLDHRSRQSAIVFAADLKEEKSGLAAVEKFWNALTQGLQTHVELVKNSPEDRYLVEYRNRGPKLSGQRTQRLRIELPERFTKDLLPQGDLALLAPLISTQGKKKRLEAYSFVRDGYAVVALGAGARSAIKNTVKLRDQNLASSQGLVQAQSSAKGCQICGFIDPLPMLRALAVHAAAESGRSKDLRKTLKELDSIKLEGVMSGGAKIEATQGEMAMFVPTSLVYPEPSQAAKLKEAIKSFEVLDDIIAKVPEGSSAR